MNDKWTPEPSDMNWLQNVYRMLKSGGQWIAPMSGQVFEKKGECLVWMNEELGDHFKIFERSKLIGRFLGISVIKKSEDKCHAEN